MGIGIIRNLVDHDNPVIDNSPGFLSYYSRLQANENKTSPDMCRGGGELRFSTDAGVGTVRTGGAGAVAAGHRQGGRQP
ncbi:hypothetical protein CBM2589_B230057 [Cupriavidus taiwanensis]|uniref:Uncharacterized protein n=1 Tax=Cupriavidus taiwanensis TaxID=164546 RepID=A0A375BQS6_9BURK|nr:hypothetical protein CBM2589_B230057 [Cupriavidus taiwanensis]